ncbi:molecular chaperone TorD family protein [Adlercreutzia sp. R25]|uniref:Molecular chaperone TorD family protein n=1 Tax=Adlercreutzia shanghongiae TaxID=3111773 RepID=A0ABU6IXJ8_9ACTN|nr:MULTISPECIES: molecular chaperone TorD family protein [unclassified Adlercreutzia]MEC4272530.1 molecular chaperone TorD family protein [Adlercreutzia sp. R25]MEC4294570.1 molecular chaperone TorD family protein [Adlercreutzia sp. R22]
MVALGKTETMDVLAARALAYRAFQRIFASEPDGALLEALGSDALRMSLELLAGNEAANAFGRTLSSVSDLGAVGDEYTRVFLGPGDLAAPPWESTYLSNDNLIFQASTLAVREAYLKAGFLPVMHPRVADDHIALELDFMSRLAQKAQGLYADDDEAGFEEELKRQKSFLNEHLLKWVPFYERRLSESGIGSFYGRILEVLTAFLAGDALALRDLLSDGL